MTENNTVLDVVINHYADNRIRYQDVCNMTIPDDADEQTYVLQDMVRAALIARIKTAGHVDVPITDGRTGVSNLSMVSSLRLTISRPLTT